MTSSTTSSTDLPVVSITTASGGGVEGRGRACAIELVALRQRRLHLGDGGRAAGMRRIAGAPPRPFFG